MTVVYDTGMDSAANQQVIEAAGLHFVGSLVPSNHPDLLAVSARRYAVIDQERFPGVTAFEARADALGAERRVIVTHSTMFHDAQTRGFAQTLAQASRRLAELADRLARRHDPDPNAGSTTCSAFSPRLCAAEISAGPDPMPATSSATSAGGQRRADSSLRSLPLILSTRGVSASCAALRQPTDLGHEPDPPRWSWAITGRVPATAAVIGGGAASG